MVFTAILLASAFQVKSPLVGLWLTEDREATVRISPCEADGHLLCGHIEKILDPSDAGALDENNPDPNLRTRPVKGIAILFHFKPGRQSDIWSQGEAYDPDKGKIYSGLELRLKDSSHLLLSKPFNIVGVQGNLSQETWTRLGE